MDESGLKVICNEIREASIRYHSEGVEDFQQKALDEICERYPLLHATYGCLNDANLFFDGVSEIITCRWKTGGWLFGTETGGDLETSIHYGDAMDILVGSANESFTMVCDLFKAARMAEARIKLWDSESKAAYFLVVREFLDALYQENPDAAELRAISKNFKEMASGEMPRHLASAILLKNVIEELRVRSHASKDDEENLRLIDDVKIWISTEFMEGEKRKKYFMRAYLDMLRACAAFFIAGASHAQWKSVIGQVFDVGCGYDCIKPEEPTIIILSEISRGFGITPERVAADIMDSLVRTIGEARNGKYAEYISKAGERLLKEGQKKQE